MRNRFSVLCSCMLLACMLTACEGEQAESGSTAESVTEALTEEPTEPGKLCYITGHGETDSAELGSFIAQVETDGYTWEEITLSAIPADADVLILCAPQEDITVEELTELDTYMDGGGHVLLLMPANDTEIRYKYLSNFLEKFCLVMDYDCVKETDTSRMLEQDPLFIQADYVNCPDNMPQYSADATESTTYLKNARSFYFTYADSYGSMKMDAVLQSAETAVGEPFGGTEDDPLTYEGEKLTLMAFARDEKRLNASVVVAGASNFLMDEYYGTEGAAAPVSLVHSMLSWFMIYQDA